MKCIFINFLFGVGGMHFFSALWICMFDTNAQQFSTHACITAFAWLIHLVSFHQYTFLENWPRLLHIFTENKETERAKYPQALNHGLIYICKKLLFIVKLCEISTVAKQCLLIFSIKVFYIEYFVVLVHVFHPLLIYIFDSKLISTSGCLLHQQQIAMIMDSFFRPAYEMRHMYTHQSFVSQCAFKAFHCV